MGLFKDTYNISHTTTAAPYPQTIHEHRAPTDDSVKLLREMEEAARKSVMDVYRFEDNALSGIVAVLKARDARDWDSRTLYVRFTLNGQLVEFQKKIDNRLAMFDMEQAYALLMERVRDAILEQLITPIGKALVKDW